MIDHSISTETRLQAASLHENGNHPDGNMKFACRGANRIQRSILWSALFSTEAFKIAATLAFTALPAATIGLVRIGLHLLHLVLRLPTAFTENRLAELSRGLPIWGSLSTAFEHALRRKLFGEAKLADVKRQGLEVVINACDLRSETAFRFGSSSSGGWR